MTLGAKVGRSWVPLAHLKKLRLVKQSPIVANPVLYSREQDGLKQLEKQSTLFGYIRGLMSFSMSSHLGLNFTLKNGQRPTGRIQGKFGVHGRRFYYSRL